MHRSHTRNWLPNSKVALLRLNLMDRVRASLFMGWSEGGQSLNGCTGVVERRSLSTGRYIVCLDPLSSSGDSGQQQQQPTVVGKATSSGVSACCGRSAGSPKPRPMAETAESTATAIITPCKKSVKPEHLKLCPTFGVDGAAAGEDHGPEQTGTTRRYGSLPTGSHHTTGSLLMPARTSKDK